MSDTLQPRDKITILRGREIQHVFVVSVPDFHPPAFHVEWTNTRGLVVSLSILRIQDENVRWMRGHLDPNSIDAHALVAANALAGYTPDTFFPVSWNASSDDLSCENLENLITNESKVKAVAKIKSITEELRSIRRLLAARKSEKGIK